MKRNHSESSYNTLVTTQLRSKSRSEAMEASIGGNFGHFGLFQRQLLFNQGLTGDGHLVDIGCGSGRLASKLKDLPNLKYTGIDVVPDLLAYAESICQRDDWRFLNVTDFAIPLEDESVDMISGFSVFTHLLHEESFAYLAEARRVLRPNGKIVFTFLDFTVPEHLSVFYSNLLQLKNRVHLNQFVHHASIMIWADLLHLDVVELVPGNQPYIQLSEPVIGDDGRNYEGRVTLGQSLCVLQKCRDVDMDIKVTLPTDFSPQSYLAANPDVAKVGLDPRVHYLSHGQFEKRKLKP